MMSLKSVFEKQKQIVGSTLMMRLRFFIIFLVNLYRGFYLNMILS